MIFRVNAGGAILVNHPVADGGTPGRLEVMGACTKKDHDRGRPYWDSCILTGAAATPDGEYEHVVGVAGSCQLLKAPAARMDFVEGTSATTTAARSSRKSAKCVEEVGAYMAGEPRACDGRTLMHTPCRYGTRYMFFRSADVSQKHSRCLWHLR